MLIQHILTADIFRAVFDDYDFHREHHLAKQVEELQRAYLGTTSRKEFLSKIGDYYNILRDTAKSSVSDPAKQGFLKNLYQEFYAAYNQKKADTLGIIYTPTEIVKFIVRHADFFLDKHFQRNLADQGVDILDPATGTGTFVCELLDFMSKGSQEKLSIKYQSELHANEVSLLAYYIACLNIAYTHESLTDQYKDFQGICFVDTLDLPPRDPQSALAGMSDENVKRVESQQAKKITPCHWQPPLQCESAQCQWPEIKTATTNLSTSVLRILL